MAGPAPKTKGWSARENVHKPKGRHLIVRGLVEVSATNKQAVLTEAPHVGKVLPLDLTIKDSGKPGKDIIVWTEAYHHKEVSANQFERVDIRWDGKTIATVPVIDDTEHRQQLGEQMSVLNAKYKGKSGPKPSKRLAAKRAAAEKAAAKKSASKKVVKKDSAKKKAPKAVGGWAKGKKAKKKTAKKAAKKSTLRGLVRRLVKRLTPAKKKSKKR